MATLHRNLIVLALAPLALLGCTAISDYPGYSEWREAQRGERPYGLWSRSQPAPELPAGTTVEVRGPDGREAPGAYGAPGLRVHVVAADGQEHSTAIDTGAIWPGLGGRFYGRVRGGFPHSGLFGICVYPASLTRNETALLTYSPAGPTLRGTLMGCRCDAHAAVPDRDGVWLVDSTETGSSGEWSWRRWRVSPDGQLTGTSQPVRMGYRLVRAPQSGRLFGITRDEVQEYDSAGTVLQSWELPGGFQEAHVGFGNLELVLACRETEYRNQYDLVVTGVTTIWGLDADDVAEPWIRLEHDRSLAINPGP